MGDERRTATARRGPSAVRRRCWWAETADADLMRYHDEEWGRPVHDDQRLFEMLTLEGAQAGLSWLTILRKRDGYRRAFADFDMRRVARFDARRRAALRRDGGIVRNRLKIDSTVSNARAFLAVQQEWGSFDRYLSARPSSTPSCRRSGSSTTTLATAFCARGARRGEPAPGTGGRRRALLSDQSSAGSQAPLKISPPISRTRTCL